MTKTEQGFNQRHHYFIVIHYYMYHIKYQMNIPYVELSIYIHNCMLAPISIIEDTMWMNLSLSNLSLYSRNISKLYKIPNRFTLCKIQIHV